MKPTHWILIALLLLVAGVDLYLYLRPPSKDTLSEVILAISHKHPMLPFALGVLTGHLLWPQTRRQS